MKDKIYNITLVVLAAFVLLIASGMIYSLTTGATNAFSEFGVFNFISSTEWDPHPEREAYGALPFIVGTVATAFLALLISLPFSLSVSLFTGEYFKGTKIASVVGTVVDLLSGVPSIVFGLWGFYTIRPIMIDMGVSQSGLGILTASIVLAFMIIPYASSLSSEFISMIPSHLKEAAYSLGATRYEMVKRVLVPSAAAGVSASYILALGRALGETMAVTMLIGNTNNVPGSLFDTGNTMASVIANQFGEADSLRLSSLMAIALLLFLVTAVINFIGKLVIKKFSY